MKDTERKRKVAESQKKKKLRGSVVFLWNLFKTVNSVWGSLGTQRHTLSSSWSSVA